MLFCSSLSSFTVLIANTSVFLHVMFEEEFIYEVWSFIGISFPVCFINVIVPEYADNLPSFPFHSHKEESEW